MAALYGTDSLAFKIEPSSQITNGEQSRIKPETDSAPASPSAHSDEDIYEDAGDLDFAGTTQGIYLTRIPKFLWETWSKLEDDDDIRLGTIRVEGSSEEPKRVRPHSVQSVFYIY